MSVGWGEMRRMGMWHQHLHTIAVAVGGAGGVSHCGVVVHASH